MAGLMDWQPTETSVAPEAQASSDTTRNWASIGGAPAQETSTPTTSTDTGTSWQPRGEFGAWNDLNAQYVRSDQTSGSSKSGGMIGKAAQLGGTYANLASGFSGSGLLGEALGPAGMVVGGIVSSVLGNAMEKASHAVLTSQPLGTRSGFEKGVIYTSKLANVGFSDAKTKNVNISQDSDFLQGIVEIDNTMYDLFSPKARTAIQDNFSWDGQKNMMNGAIVEDRYYRMLDTAAESGDTMSKNALQMVQTQRSDYQKAYDALNSVIPTNIKDLQQKQKSSALNEVFGGDTKTQPVDAFGTPQKSYVNQLATAVKGVDQDTLMASAYKQYQNNGGQMRQDLFNSLFSQNLTQDLLGPSLSAGSGVTSSGDYSAPTAEQQIESTSPGFGDGNFGGGKTPYGSPVQRELLAVQMKHSGQPDNPVYHTDIQDFLGYMAAGLKGYTYNQIVGASGAQSQAPAVTSTTDTSAGSTSNEWGNVAATSGGFFSGLNG